MEKLAIEFNIIKNWVDEHSFILDLGSADGKLCQYLTETKNTTGYGVEIEIDNVKKSISNNINSLHLNLNNLNLRDFFSYKLFDVAIMTQAIQIMHRPDELIRQMVKISNKAIVTFPNFGYWRLRLQLMFKGRMPESKTLPYSWYNTPNIHLCTFKDFEYLCKENNIEIIEKKVIENNNFSLKNILLKAFPNLFGSVAIYCIREKKNV